MSDQMIIHADNLMQKPTARSRYFREELEG